jgi:hypothetical protein
MKITLIRTGGFIPVTKIAEAETDMTLQEVKDLIVRIAADPRAIRVKDGTCYELRYGSISSHIDPEKAPEKYKPLFSRLKNDLRIVVKGE